MLRGAEKVKTTCKRFIERRKYLFIKIYMEDSNHLFKQCASAIVVSFSFEKYRATVFRTEDLEKSR